MSLLGIPFDFVLFALTLLGVATLHHHALKVALGGALAITLYQLFVTGFKAGAGMGGLAAHAGHEWVTLANLLGLLLGFALLADHFEKSRLPEILPHLLPDDCVAISSTARNFKGRMGSAQAQVYLGSPYTVAASAVAGHIADPREMLG